MYIRKYVYAYIIAVDFKNATGFLKLFFYLFIVFVVRFSIKCFSFLLTNLLSAEIRINGASQG
jgi:hypothetical protein